MPFTISDDYLPAVLAARRMTDDDFIELCAEHPDLSFEMSAGGELIVMAPTHSETGMRNSELGFQLRAWAKNDSRGCVCDSSTGFVLPNGARRSPDASWTLRSRVDTLDQESKDGFWHLCPDFVIELKSESDRLRTLQRKMQEYLENGAQLGWLIDPDKRSVTVYRPNEKLDVRSGIESISGEGPVAGFTLVLPYIWDPLGVR